jgi:hypothetical protein
MKRLRYIGLLPLITALAWGRAVGQGNSTAQTNRPDAFVSRFYKQVVARHPIGLPTGADKKFFESYLSKSLIRRFDLDIKCVVDWKRQNPDPNLKPPFALVENGLFSGSSEEAEPKAFHIERTQFGKDGSSRVYVKLTWSDPANKPFSWYVAVVVISENGRVAVDDVFYLKNKTGDIESSLSKELSFGCDGARWVGDDPH